MCEASCAWCTTARRSHTKVVMEAAKLPPRVRRKVDRPEPEAISLGLRSDSRMVSTGMKNSATPRPWKPRTRATCVKSTPM